MPNADMQRAAMIASYMADEPVVEKWMALRPRIYAALRPGDFDPILYLIDSHLKLLQRRSKSSLGFEKIGPSSGAPRFMGQLTSPLPNCSKRRRRPWLGCAQLSSTSSRGMTATFSKRVVRTSRRFCGRPFFKTRCLPRRLAPRKETVPWPARALSHG
jgi:hypothetical protein